MDFLIFIVIILLGLFFWKRAEKKHYASIQEREEKYKNIIVISDRDLKRAKNNQSEGVLFVEGTVVSIDSFKKLMASFVNIFGWRMKAYESLVDRARREAVLKVKQRAYDGGYNVIANLRLETSSISKWAKKTVWSVEAIAYATGVKVVSAWK
jgi:uncharacterized protein YbjQ (UPF0145 family)